MQVRVDHPHLDPYDGAERWPKNQLGCPRSLEDQRWRAKTVSRGTCSFSYHIFFNHCLSCCLHNRLHRLPLPLPPDRSPVQKKKPKQDYRAARILLSLLHQDSPSRREEAFPVLHQLLQLLSSPPAPLPWQESIQAPTEWKTIIKVTFSSKTPSVNILVRFFNLQPFTKQLRVLLHMLKDNCGCATFIINVSECATLKTHVQRHMAHFFQIAITQSINCGPPLFLHVWRALPIDFQAM